MKSILKSGMAAAGLLVLGAAAFAAQPGASNDRNSTERHAKPAMTMASTNCTAAATAGGMTALNSAYGPASDPTSAGMAANHGGGAGAIANVSESANSAASRQRTDVAYSTSNCGGGNGGRTSGHH